MTMEILPFFLGAVVGLGFGMALTIRVRCNHTPMHASWCPATIAGQDKGPCTCGLEGLL